MMKHVLALVLVSACCIAGAQNVGINTNSPQTQLEVVGNEETILRVRASNSFTGVAGLQLMKTGTFFGVDWEIRNDNGNLTFLTNGNDFNIPSAEVMRISPGKNLGVGTMTPVAKLHVDGGTDASNSNHGYIVVGDVGSTNVVFDNNEILARNNGAPGTLHLQGAGGNTAIGFGNGMLGVGITVPQSKLHVFGGDEASLSDHGHLVLGSVSGQNLVMDGNEILARSNGSTSTLYLQHHGGNVNIGTGASGGALNIEDDLFQLYLRNDQGDVNDWYIGASSAAWAAGDDQLVFSPTATSADGILRLTDVSDNDGSSAPLSIVSSPTQRILMDGNEIDAISPLYINHNTDQDTYINPSGGTVGIGTNNPSGGIMHVSSGSSTFPLAIERYGEAWQMGAAINGNLIYSREGLAYALASVDAVAGFWTALSDVRAKEEIVPLGQVTDRVMQLSLYDYQYKHDPADKSYIGAMAQDLLPLFPQCVSEHDGMYGVQYGQLAVIALTAIQEQQVQIEALQKELAALREDD